MKWMITERSEDMEREHVVDSLNLLIFVSLLILTILTVWFLKRIKLKFVHETGLSIIYGMIVGAIIKSTTPYHSPTMMVETPSETDLSVRDLNTPWIPQSSSNNSFINIKKSDDKENDGFHVPSVEAELEESAQFSPELFFNVLLPPIIFQAGYNMKRNLFFKNIGSIALIAAIGTLISTFTTALIVFGCMSMMEFSWPFINCLKFGAIISATDPVSVLAIFTDLKVDTDLYNLVFGESVLNDAVAIVLVTTVSAYESEDSGFSTVAVFKAIGNFLGVFMGAFSLGCLMGCITAFITKFTHLRDYPLLETSLFILMSYATFLAAEAAQMTGIVALLFCGICQAHYTYKNLSPESRSSTKEICEFMNFLMENFVFLYIGVATFTFHKHIWNIPFIAFSFLAILVARAVNIYPMSAILNLGKTVPIPASFQHFMMFGGLRGAMAFALAIRETANPMDCTIFSTTLLIVGTTILVSGAFTINLLSGLGIKTGVVSEIELFETTDNTDFYQRENRTDPFLFKMFYRFDHRFLTPLLTHTRPSLIETAPACCIPFARLFTSHKQMQSERIMNTSDSQQIVQMPRRNLDRDGSFQDEYGYSEAMFNNDNNNYDRKNKTKNNINKNNFNKHKINKNKINKNNNNDNDSDNNNDNDSDNNSDNKGDNNSVSHDIFEGISTNENNVDNLKDKSSVCMKVILSGATGHSL